MCPVDEAVALLGEPIDIFATIAVRLKERKSAYAALFEAVVAMSKVKPDQARIDEVMAEAPEDTSLEALDKEWEEAAAFDGQPGQPGCDSCPAPSTDGLDLRISP